MTIEQPSFDRLKPYQRRAFVMAEPGFFDRVVARLEAAGIRTTKSTANRTWNGKFGRRNPAIVAALEAEYNSSPRRKPRRVA